MNPALLISIAIAVGIAFVIVVGASLMVKAFYIKVAPGQALVNNKTGETVVSLTGGLVMPIIHRAEVMDLSVKMVELERRGREGLICKDNIRADIKVAFFVRVNESHDDIKKVAARIGCARASHRETLMELFAAKFSEALKTVGYQMMFVELYTERRHFRDRIIEVIGTDLDGYHLNDVAIDYLEQTPMDQLDPHNTLDAEGIRAITQITKLKEIETNRLNNEAQMQIETQNTSAQEVITKQDAMRKAVIAARQREALVAQAREQAEALKEAAEQKLKQESARIASEEQIAVSEVNKQRQIEVAMKNKERVVGIEQEKSTKDKSLEAINREREVELSRIEKEKLIEVQKKEIADVVRMRVAVEKTVAEEEERIKGVRVLEEAKRQRDSALIAAEAEAQSSLVKDIKAAEAQEKASQFIAKQRLTLADAELEVAERDAKAKIRRAEGIQAEAAAPGLAGVKVKEADATALEKRGLVEAKIEREKGNAIADVAQRRLEAEARGEEAKGTAAAKVKQLDAQAEQTRMTAVALGKEAEAGAVEKMGLAEAVAIREKGHAEADAIQNKMTAEADGVSKKMTAMKAMEGSAREHEEYRLRLENERVIRLEGLHIQQKIAEQQSMVLGKAFENAKIDIVGGDGQFFDRFVNAISLGKSIDAVVAKSQIVTQVASEYTSGDRSLVADIKEVLTRPALDASELRDLGVTAMLTKMLGGSKGAEKKKLEALMDKAKELGFE